MKVNFWRGVGLSSEMLYETMCSSFCDNDKSETTGAIYSLSSPVSATVRNIFGQLLRADRLFREMAEPFGEFGCFSMFMVWVSRNLDCADAVGNAQLCQTCLTIYGFTFGGRPKSRRSVISRQASQQACFASSDQASNGHVSKECSR